MPTVSVIMGVYNCKSYEMLKRSVESIINQTYTDWEFIICDDGSTNDTKLFLEKIKLMDPRIKIIYNKENKGLHYALNSCLKVAKGKYIARQDDDDDFSVSERLEKQVDFLNDNSEYSFVSSNMKIFDDNGIYGCWKGCEKPTKKDFLWASPFCHAASVMRIEALTNVDGYRVAPETSRTEDYDLFMRMYANGMKGYNLQEDLYYYRVVRDLKVKYRPMKDRINEAKVRYIGFKKLGILFIGIPFIIKPILIGLIPVRILNIINEKKYSV